MRSSAMIDSSAASKSGDAVSGTRCTVSHSNGPGSFATLVAPTTTTFSRRPASVARMFRAERVPAASSSRRTRFIASSRREAEAIDEGLPFLPIPHEIAGKRLRRPAHHLPALLLDPFAHLGQANDPLERRVEHG